MTGWLWHARSRLRSADAEQSRVDTLLGEAADCCTILLMFKPSGRVPPALVATFTDDERVAAKLHPRLRWRKLVAVVRATIRWRASVMALKRTNVTGAVPRFIRAMLEIRACPVYMPELSKGYEQDQCQETTGCLLVLLVLILHNYQRAVTRASGLQAFRALAVAVHTPSVLADALLPLSDAMQRPQLVDGHPLTRLAAVGDSVTGCVTATFQALYSELLGVLEKSCRAVERSVGTANLTGSLGTDVKAQEPAQTNECKVDEPRCFDARTVLVLLKVWGLTIRPNDWEFMEGADVMGIISRASAQFALHGVRAPGSTGGVATQGLRRDTTNDGSVARKGHKSCHPGSVPEEKRALATCHAACWTLFRLLTIQLHGMDSTSFLNNDAQGSLAPLGPIANVLYEELRKCVPQANCSAGIARQGAECGVRGPQHRDRTPSQATLEFDTPGVGAFSYSPRHGRVTPGIRAPGSGVSHKRRCQELVSSPRRLMNMEDGLVFPAENVLSNPRGSDFSITFWLLLAQDRTGHHRTVLARGHRSERWPVVLLRDTDNHLEVRILPADLHRGKLGRLIRRHQ